MRISISCVTGGKGRGYPAIPYTDNNHNHLEFLEKSLVMRTMNWICLQQEVSRKSPVHPLSMYRIAGKFGVESNLAVWLSILQPPT